MEIKGKISSFQSLGAVDGPGVRFVAFLKGCPLNCVCCHNPETKDFSGGQEYTACQVVEKAKRYKEYFGDNGGITLSGGEPIAQPLFSAEIFKAAHNEGIHTCLDTSGCYLNDEVKELLTHTDLVMLDIKYTNSQDYLKYVGCSLDSVIEFLDYLNTQKISTWIRQVIIPTLNDNNENILRLKKIVSKYSCIEKIELLPFRKICETKYEELNLVFPLKNTPEPDNLMMDKLKSML